MIQTQKQIFMHAHTTTHAFAYTDAQRDLRTYAHRQNQICTIDTHKHTHTHTHTRTHINTHVYTHAYKDIYT